MGNVPLRFGNTTTVGVTPMIVPSSVRTSVAPGGDETTWMAQRCAKDDGDRSADDHDATYERRQPAASHWSCSPRHMHRRRYVGARGRSSVAPASHAPARAAIAVDTGGVLSLSI
jgi:hypothetical protein